MNAFSKIMLGTFGLFMVSKYWEKSSENFLIESAAQANGNTLLPPRETNTPINIAPDITTKPTQVNTGFPPIVTNPTNTGGGKGSGTCTTGNCDLGLGGMRQQGRFIKR